jgi:polysaccharide chain length determinant protein (PEP-CTERM system associated)
LDGTTVIPGKTYTPADLVRIARHNWWVILLPFLAVTLGTIAVASRLPNRFRSETLILVVPQRVPESYVRSTVTARVEDRLQSISQQILSRTRLERIIHDFTLYDTELRTRLMEDIVEQMRRDIEVEIVKGDAFRIGYIGRDPRTVMKVTERLASLFIEENTRDRAVLAEDSYEFLDTQLEEARRRLVEHEKKLEDYRHRYTGQLPSQVESNLQVIQSTQLQIQSISESTARDRDRRAILERLLADAMSESPAPVPAAAQGGTPAVPEPSSTAQQLEAARLVLQQASLRLKPEHPDIIRQKRTVEALTHKLELEAAQVPLRDDAPRPGVSPAEQARQNRITETKAELEALDLQLAHKAEDEKRLREVAATYQARVEAAPTRESELIALTRDYDTDQRSYTSLLTKKEDSKIAANLERRQIGEQFKVLDPARMAERPFSPNRRQIDLIGALVGLGIGIGLVVLREFANSTLKNDDDVVTALSLPVLAMVPVIATRRDPRVTLRRRVTAAFASTAAVGVMVVVALILWNLRG